MSTSRELVQWHPAFVEGSNKHIKDSRVFLTVLIRYQVCRLIYQGCRIYDARDFERNLAQQLPSGAWFCGRRFILPPGQVCYDVIVDLSRRISASSVGAMFALPGDFGGVEVWRRPSRGEGAALFLRQQMKEMYAEAQRNDGQVRIFGGIGLKPPGECDHDQSNGVALAVAEHGGAEAVDRVGMQGLESAELQNMQDDISLDQWIRENLDVEDAEHHF